MWGLMVGDRDQCIENKKVQTSSKESVLGDQYFKMKGRNFTAEFISTSVWMMIINIKEVEILMIL